MVVRKSTKWAGSVWKSCQHRSQHLEFRWASELTMMKRPASSIKKKWRPKNRDSQFKSPKLPICVVLLFPTSRMDHNSLSPSGWSTILPQDSKSRLIYVVSSLVLSKVVRQEIQRCQNRWQYLRNEDRRRFRTGSQGTNRRQSCNVSFCSEESTSFKKGSCIIARTIEDASWWCPCSSFLGTKVRYVVNEAACLWLAGILPERFRYITRRKISGIYSWKFHD